MLRDWADLPLDMQNQAVRPYYQALIRHKGSLVAKRFLDVLCAAILLLVLSPLMLVLAFWVTLDSPGGVFFMQKRVTAYGREFTIYKFRTMVDKAEQMGPAVTQEKDSRVTKAGRFLRKLRMDEMPQLLNILKGDMSFVGTRPESPRYVAQYTDEMKATLLLPAGLTSLASVKYKDEARLLDAAKDPDKTYIEEILPQKMKLNLQTIREFSLWSDILVFLRTGFVALDMFGSSSREDPGTGKKET